MNVKEEIQNFRHILFRFKAKLVYDSRIGKAYRRAVWKIADEQDGLRTIYWNERPAFDKHQLDHVHDPELVRRFSREMKQFNMQLDAVYQGDGDIFIEPENGLAFFADRKFILPTRTKAHHYLVPGVLDYYLHKAFKQKYTEYDSVIHFDGFIGKNLYHFIDESVNGLLLLLRTGKVDPQTPVLINESVYKLKYVQYILGLPELERLNWVVQKPGEWIRTKCFYKGVAGHDAWGDIYELVGKQIIKNPHRRVFLNRKPFYQRRLINNDAIEAMVKGYGFEVVYAEDLTYEQQVQLFSEIKYFVSLHGGGVTNLIYTDLSQVHAMEIFADGLVHPHYYLFLEKLGIKYYDGIIGTKLDINWNYSIDETQFRRQLDLMMQQG